MASVRPISAWIDDLQSEGRYVFTTPEARAAGKRSDVALQAALRRLRQARRIASPKRSFHVIVPLEYRSAGCPPASWFIDDLMRFLGKPYYVGILSAAALHGAAHQQPMVFQVVAPEPIRPIVVGRNRIEFHRSSGFSRIPTQRVTTETGTMRVATPEATAFDLVRFAGAAGHVDNIATVLAELAESLDPGRLADLASLHAVPDVQRLGYLLERVGADQLASQLGRELKDRRVRPVRLEPGSASHAAEPVASWNVIVDHDPEIDV